MDEPPILIADDAAKWTRLQAKIRRGIESLDRREGNTVEQAFDELDDYLDELAKRRERKDAA
jgi:hypothetical protein